MLTRLPTRHAAALLAGLAAMLVAAPAPAAETPQDLYGWLGGFAQRKDRAEQLACIIRRQIGRTDEPARERYGSAAAAGAGLLTRLSAEIEDDRIDPAQDPARDAGYKAMFAVFTARALQFEEYVLNTIRSAQGETNVYLDHVASAPAATQTTVANAPTAAKKAVPALKDWAVAGFLPRTPEERKAAIDYATHRLEDLQRAVDDINGFASRLFATPGVPAIKLLADGKLLYSFDHPSDPKLLPAAISEATEPAVLSLIVFAGQAPKLGPTERQRWLERLAKLRWQEFDKLGC